MNRRLNGFDLDGITSFNLEWTNTASGSYPIVYTPDRRGGNCIRQSYATKCLRSLPAATQYTVGFACYLESIPGASGQPIVSFADEVGNVQTCLTICTTGYLVIKRGTYFSGIVIATSSRTINAGAWHYIEFQTFVGDTTGTTAVRIDGATISEATFTGDTKAGTANIAAVFFGGGSRNEIFRWDDFYANDPSGTTNTEFLGEVKVTGHLPAGDGANTGLTPSAGTTHSILVDDAVANDSDYVSGASGKDTYLFADLAYTPATVFAVKVAMVAKKDDTSARYVNSVVRYSAADTSGTPQAISDSYAPYSEIWETLPGTTTAWDKTIIDATEFGIQIT